MRYYFKILFTLEKKHLINIFIDIVCLSLGFLIAIIFLSQGSAAYSDYLNDKKGFLLDNYLVCIPQTDSARLLSKDFDEIMRDYNEIDSIQMFNRKNEEMMIYQQSFCPNVTIIEVTDHYFDIFEKGYIIGNKAINNGSAIIGKKCAEQYDIKLGDEVIVSNNKIIVSGIIDIPKYNNSLFVLEKTINNSEPYDCKYFVKFSQLKEKKEFINYIENVYGKYDVYSGKEYVELQKERLLEGWSFSIVIAIVTICYGLINIFNIESFFVIQQKKEMAILRALGASKANIMIVKLFRALVIAVASSSVTSLIVWILEHTRMTELIEFHLNYWVYLIATTMIMFIYAVYSYILYRIHYSEEISQIISKI